MKRNNPQRRLLFHVERLFTRGLFYKLVFIWAMIVTIALIAGLVAELLPADHFDTYQDAVWWAFLRLSDPGYLSEDDAPGLRAVAVILTVLGLAIFVGALVAIITQWLDDKMDRLSLGMTPITITNHYVILGWTSRTLELISSIIGSKPEGSQRPIAVLVDRVTPQLLQQIRDRLGKNYDDRRVILRSGDVHNADDVQRVNCDQARLIVIPGRELALAGLKTRDAGTLKILASLDASMSSLGEFRPRIATEIFDPALVPVAQAAYRGLGRVVASDTVVGQSLALSVLAPGLFGYFFDLANPSKGDRIVIREYPELVGSTVIEAALRLDGGTLIMAFHHDEDGRNLVSPESKLRAGDTVVVLTNAQVEPNVCDPISVPEPQYTDKINSAAARVDEMRILLVGWSGKGPDFLQQLGSQTSYRYTVDIMSRRAEVERRIPKDLPSDLEIHHFTGDSASITDLQQIDLSTYDRIILLASDDAPDIETADARTIGNYLVVEHVLDKIGSEATPVVELLSPPNLSLFKERRAQVFVTPLALADVLAGTINVADLDVETSELTVLDFGSPRVFRLSDFVQPHVEFSPRELGADLRKLNYVPLSVKRRDEYAAHLVYGRSAKAVAEAGDLLLVLDMNTQPDDRTQ